MRRPADQDQRWVGGNHDDLVGFTGRPAVQAGAARWITGTPVEPIALQCSIGRREPNGRYQFRSKRDTTAHYREGGNCANKALEHDVPPPSLLFNSKSNLGDGSNSSVQVLSRGVG